MTAAADPLALQTSGPRLSTTRARALVGAAGLSATLAIVTLLRARLAPGGTLSAFAAGAAVGVALLGIALLADRSREVVRRPTSRQLGLGITGGALLVALPALLRSGPAVELLARPDPLLAWALVTCLVAAGEEAMLRGALFDALRVAGGTGAAIVLTSAAFALIHVPLYGWHVVPLDLAVGLLLGGIRLVSGGIAAPVVAHALADLATWWL